MTMPASDRSEPLPKPASAAAPIFRATAASDLPGVMKVQTEVYEESLLERLEVFADRLALFPAGCFVAVSPATGAVLGYVFAHPWTLSAPPPLDEEPGGLPDTPDCFYVHDLAVRVSGEGLGRRLFGLAEEAAGAFGFGGVVALVSVQSSRPFWKSLGFRAVEEASLSEHLREKLEGYGGDAVYMIKRSQDTRSPDREC
mmetsp:Transcript_27334/g.62740  ORF Transcript_27334/g.62740 Transcript_27334/m.62740 type:complete len:199 (-) Transcript_27334:606-1202(-)